MMSCFFGTSKIFLFYFKLLKNEKTQSWCRSFFGFCTLYICDSCAYIFWVILGICKFRTSRNWIIVMILKPRLIGF